ncbi:hypothetical protein N7517_003046 [Penicillium concentricum]|uniref:Lanthionine synthetase C family protein n=1 Tax=Penicillium concentricum TaxID=293559 RepID=A0A9W9VLM9_9EURO|nr:uncharacterized protein N7517_003046 [Penicillium concentricum]KAJ5385135.1 hypothetical protein N7517_003046 [Penicillium concentricum]
MAERPQYFENTLTPLPINATTLFESLQELRAAVRNGAELVQENALLPETWGPSGMFRAFPGIALAFLRLDYQSSVLEDHKAASIDYRRYALERIPSSLPDTPLLASRLSPVGSSSPVTAVTLRILGTFAKNNWQDGANVSITKEDITCLHDATQWALKNEPLVPHDGRKMGGDEMLFGRAGLLWALLNVRAHHFDQETQEVLSPVLGAIPELIRVIVDAGREGSKEYTEKNGAQHAHPLMYAWIEGYYGFGAVHGITGILTILLSCGPQELADYLPVIGGTITALCKLSGAANGHLPMTLPPYGSGRRSELVQLCHGSPGLLILLGAALKNKSLTHAHWDPSWDQAIYLGTERVWEEGLLSKGGSLCHGVTGNAWAWLLLHDCFEYHLDILKDARTAYLQRSQLSALPNAEANQTLTSDFFLSKALAFMLHARETKPYNSSPTSSDKDYRMPDEPYSLFEGLAGNFCAWADTCVVIQARLRKMELVEQGICTTSGLSRDPVFRAIFDRQLGFPALGGNGATGIF